MGRVHKQISLFSANNSPCDFVDNKLSKLTQEKCETYLPTYKRNSKSSTDLSTSGTNRISFVCNNTFIFLDFSQPKR